MSEIKQTHWIDNPTARAKFFAAGGQRGLDHGALCELLGVEHLHDYQGTMQDAAAILAAWDARQAPPEEPAAVEHEPAPTAMPVAIPTEAPASFTVKAYSPGGYDCLICLRDTDAGSLMKRAEALLAWLATKNYTPPPQRGAAASNGSAASDGDTTDAPMCPTHHKAMKRSNKGTGWFCPVKLLDDDGTGKAVYCRQKA